MKSKDSAIASFVLGLLCWIPYLNWGIGSLALYFGASALFKIHKYPDQYEGLGFAIAGSVLGLSTLALNILGAIFA